MKKRLLSRVLAVFMTLIMLLSNSIESLAYIGPIISHEEVTKHGEFTEGGVSYAYIQNEYIHFDICTDTGKLNWLGTMTHTVPTAVLKDKFAGIDQNGRQLIKHQYVEASLVDMDKSKNDIAWNDLTVKSIKIRYNVNDKIILYSTEDGETYEKADMAVDYTFNENDLFMVTNYYSLVKMNYGDTEATTIEQVKPDETDKTQNWGVVCRSICQAKNEYRHTSDDKLIDKDGNTIEEGRNMGYYYRTIMTYEDFPKMGHSNITKENYPDVAINAQAYLNSGTMAHLNISNGVSDTANNSVVEIYSDSYSFGAPFVAGSYNYIYVDTLQKSGIYGHSGYYPETFNYNNYTLTGTVRYESCYKIQFSDYYTNIIAECSHLWGFRSLSTEEEINDKNIEPDTYRIQGDEPYLCVFENGKDNKGNKAYKVVPASNEEEIKTLVSKYGKCVAEYRGTYYIDTIGGKTAYAFSGCAVGLSPSICATWDPLKGNVILMDDGELKFNQNNINLNAPTFKFYEPKNGGGLKFDGYDDKLGLKFDIDSDKNSACFNIDLPGNGVAVKGASIDTTGNLVFTGKFKINLFAASMEMQKLGYGLNEESKFVCNGIQAEGKLKVPKIGGSDDDDDEKEKDASPNVLGFGGAEMTGKINTFDGEELYDFTFKLSIKNLFDTKAELTLVRLNNGRLCPDHLYFSLEMTGEGVGLDIPPGTPVVTLTGGEGGIDGLAKTIDGNYTAIPPIVLTLGAYGQIVKVVDGKLIGRIGPSQIRLAGEDVAFKVGDDKLKIIDSMYAGISLNGKEVNYNGKTYRGIAFGGEMGMGLKIFNFKDDDKDALAESLKFFNNTIEAKVGLSFETFAGKDVAPSNWTYVYIGSTGTASCSLNIPAGVKAIGGKKLLGAGLDYKIGAYTAFEAGKGSSSASAFFKNAKLAGGIAATGYVWPVYGRVIYLFPSNKVSLTGKLFKQLDDVNWEEELVEVKNSPETPETINLSDPELVMTEDGEQALVFAEANIKQLPIEIITDEIINEQSVIDESELVSFKDANEEVSEDDVTEEVLIDEFAEEKVTEEEIADEEVADEEPVSEVINDNDSIIEEDNIKEYLDTENYSKTFKTSAANIADGEKAVFAIVPKNAEDIIELEKSINCSLISNLKWMPDEITVTDTDPGYNAWVSTYETDDDGNITKKAVYISVPKEDIVKANELLTVSADCDYEIKGLATTPVTALNVSESGNKLKTAIDNPDNTKEYIQYTYMGKKIINDDGKEQVSTDYLLDSVEINSQNITSAHDIIIPSTGDIAPTSDYYIATMLMEKTKIEITDENGDTQIVDTEIPVNSWESDSSYHYTNDSVKEPSNVALELLGNEAMKGSWIESENADGYKVSIYQENDKGEWIDTERGYSFDKEQFANGEANIQGLSYDADTKTYSIEMAMTVGDDGSKKQVTLEDGTVMNIDSSKSKALEAGKTYKIGVSAIKKASVTLDGEDTVYEKYSMEAVSEAKLLPVYKQVSFDVLLNDNKLIKESDNAENGKIGVYNATVKGDVNSILRMEGFKSDTTDVSGDVSTKVNVITVNDSGEEIKTPITSNLDGYYELPDFEGVLQLELDVAYTHDGVTDNTLEYLYVEKDSTAPGIVLHNDITYADKDGKYTVTGITEPGAKVKVEIKGNDDEENINAEATVDEDGIFSYTGQLIESETKFVDFRAIDLVGNESDIIMAAVSTPDITHTVVFEDGFGNVISTKEVKHGESVIAPEEVNPPAEYSDYTFDGWSEDCSSITKNITIKALWIGAHIVKFEDGSGNVISEQTVKHGESAIAPENPDKEGYKFDGWDVEFSEVISDLVIKAIWKEAYTVVFEDGFDNVLSEQIVGIGEAAEAPDTPTKEGYTFVKWDIPFDEVNSDLVIKAIWEKSEESGNDEKTDKTDNKEETDNKGNTDNKDSNDNNNKTDNTNNTDKKDKTDNSNNNSQNTNTNSQTGNTSNNNSSSINNDVKVTGITINGISNKIAAGKKITLTASISPNNASVKDIVWSSSNTKIATVSDKGVVKIKKKTGGKSVTITATAKDGSNVKGTWTIKVMKGVVKKIKLSGSKSVKAGKSIKLKAKINASKGSNKKLNWISSAPEYVIVSNKGVVKAGKNAKGKKVTITVMSTDGSNIKKSIKIKVK